MMKRLVTLLSVSLLPTIAMADDALCQIERVDSSVNMASPATTPTTRFEAVDGRSEITVFGNTTQVDPVTDYEGATIIHDTKTGLMWTKCLLGYELQNGLCIGTGQLTYTWNEALQAAEAASLNVVVVTDAVTNTTAPVTYNDWRLPNVKELASLVERKCAYPALNVDVFTGGGGQGVDGDAGVFSVRTWTNTSERTLDAGVWFVDFSDGHSYVGNVGSDSHYVRLVRDAP